ncbi:MAG: hypothetical protein Q8P44_09605, partial [Dehalococcoidia bacterium]|nr:hypothetical protein [Dehalococcoidia bacterium]
MKRLFLIVVALVLLGSVSLNCKRQASQEMPRSITLGTHAAGSLFHAVGSGLASVLTKNSGMEVVIAPHPGPVAW